MPIDSDTPGVPVPFIDLLQDMDEVDAHIRNGIGGGVWYNLDRHTNIGIEGQYLDGSGDPNPMLSHETRMMVWISGQF